MEEYDQEESGWGRGGEGMMREVGKM